MRWVALAIAALLVLFVFPYAFSVLLIAAVALVVPAAGLGFGVLLDVLYFTKGAAPFPYATVTGLIISLIAMAVQRFVRAHVMTRT